MDTKTIWKYDPLEKAIIDHVDDVAMSYNELTMKPVLNRNLVKLLENDAAIGSLTENVRNGIYRLMPYIFGATYQKNDIVFFTSTYTNPILSAEWNAWYEEALTSAIAQGIPVDSYEDKNGVTYEEAWLSCNTTSLFLLRSTRNNNSTVPVLSWIDMIPKFDASGWVNENPMGTIYTDYFGIYLKDALDKMLYEQHESDPDYHKFGKLSAYSDMNRAVLRTNLSNIDEDRKGFHFPGITTTLKESNVILDGQCRKWDCGLLEYTIEFKLGTDEEVLDSYNEDGTVRRLDQIDVNYLNLKTRPVILNDDFLYDNSDYYLSEKDADIFKIPGGKARVMNNIYQVNTNKRINALQGTIRFPVPFIDTNYAIFCQTPPCVCYADGDSIEQNVNQMVFVNKSNQSVTALLVVPTYEGSEPKLLHTNRFRMQVTGRWKKTKEEREAEELARKRKEEEERLANQPI